MRVNWKKLRSQIPSRVLVGKKPYEIVWVDSFPPNSDGTHTQGETRYEARQIALKTGETDKNTVSTYLHELLHAIQHEEDAGLTEPQVSALENSLRYVMKPGNVFSNGK